MTRKSPQAATNDVAGKKNGGRRHRRSRRGARGQTTVAPEALDAPTEEPEQGSNRYVRLTEESVLNRPLTPVEAAEQEVARCKELLLHALRSTQGAAATAARVREEAAAAAEQLQRITAEEDALCEQLHNESVASKEAARARREAEAAAAE